jgi:hypothetical protein
MQIFVERRGDGTGIAPSASSRHRRGQHAGQDSVNQKRFIV